MRCFSLLLIVAACCQAVMAQGETFVAVTTGYGGLAEALGDNANEIDSLVVEGKMGKEDFRTAWSCSFNGRLKSLNLEKAEIEKRTSSRQRFLAY